MESAVLRRIPIDGSRCDRILSRTLTPIDYFDGDYVEKQPVTWKDGLCRINYTPFALYKKLFQVSKPIYFMLSGRISRNSGENIFRSYTGTTSENTDFHVLVALVNCACLITRRKYDVIYLTFLALDVIL